MIKKVYKTLDCIGLLCPMPIIKTKVELANMKSGQILEILADDIRFAEEIQEWCEKTGQVFLGAETENGIIKGYLRKK